MPILRSLVLLACTLLCASCSLVGSEPDATLRVLFVGNSLTYTNDLPRAVADLAEADGQRFHVEAVAGANLSLEDHWTLGEAPTRIAEGGWDVVVMQQGPSTLPESREHLIEWVGRFADLARDEGVRPAVYMVWPPRPTPITLSEQSYAAAAEAHDALMLPAGRAWRLALQHTPSLPLYGSDGFHPSVLGTALAALTVYGGIMDRLPNTLPQSLTVGGFDVSLRGEQGLALVLAAEAALD